jgi:hypothetical protein
VAISKERNGKHLSQIPPILVGKDYNIESSFMLEDPAS